ncbi:MAG: hypothetical protein IMZ61_00125, partial [Planctomycetes bacterium]|nr:hypothetical protein [Planctomycetota bacterium]
MTVTKRVLVAMGSILGESPDVIIVTVTNMGRRAASVTSVAFRIGHLKKKNFAWIPPVNQFSGTLPATIEDGKTISLVARAEEYYENIEKITKQYFKGLIGSLRLRSLRYFAFTSTRKTAKCKPEKEILTDLRLSL